ncbi:MAG: hypothetical protein LBQ40_03530 [Clostridiales bacterium]|nr:hypothetical protein [Clostridiales bacterium]
MKNMKKIVLMVLLLSATVLMLTSCPTDDSPPPSPTIYAGFHGVYSAELVSPQYGVSVIGKVRVSESKVNFENLLRHNHPIYGVYSGKSYSGSEDVLLDGVDVGVSIKESGANYDLTWTGEVNVYVIRAGGRVFVKSEVLTLYFSLQEITYVTTGNTTFYYRVAVSDGATYTK